MTKAGGALLALGLVVTVGCANGTTATDQPSTTLILSAATSLGKPLETLRADYQRQHPDMEITLNLGASGILQKQIEQGAPADLFWSAGTAQMDALEQKNLLVAGTRRDLVQNQLVLVRRAGSTLKSFQDLATPTVTQIAIGTPETVPAGKYAQETLSALGLWDAVQSKLIYGKDVTSVLTYVERQAVDAGLVYRTDALASTKVEIVATADEATHQPILYPLAVLQTTQHRQQAEEFATYLHGAHAQEILTRAGFLQYGN
ncbi:molybdate ABC transporter substrate-binding protein [Tumebacillus permanentifrigoris]|uniref:Molybdate transport system substrate-binding protein n=1 Tax=Tumebacillus permanentifrigoris TaxID=378543 RepID=A0A316D790_9BACL|nr:molybdate ABC transporter substrate-binding protein [Tumebacillus permanentifrigoris]PWK11594.1 molybdate transport system substrate-binding protein [Tumebacillus permanentifrigoris]